MSSIREDLLRVLRLPMFKYGGFLGDIADQMPPPHRSNERLVARHLKLLKRQKLVESGISAHDNLMVFRLKEEK